MVYLILITEFILVRFFHMKNRGFEEVNITLKKFKNNQVILPVRATMNSAGYDFFAAEDKLLQPKEQYIFWTDVKAYMLTDEVLKIYIRSSLAIKNNLSLVNQTGIIDSDYYSNITNDGNIGICLKNNSDEAFQIHLGDRIAQGVFEKYLKIDDDNNDTTRIGGVGSTNA